MSTTYEKAPNAIQAMVERAMEQYHPDLAKLKVTIDTIIVSRLDRIPGGEDGDTEAVHAMKRGGYPIDAKIGVTSLQDRARGIADAKLMIDGLEWNKATDRQRAALIDHELEHLDLVQLKPTKKEPDRTGPQRDDLGRACLKIRPHDWVLAGFQTVAERHGHHSHEALQFANFRAEYAQLNLFGNEVLAIAEGRNGKNSDHVKLSGPAGETIFEGTSKEFEEAARRVSRGTKSKACKNRHHTRCKSDGCNCTCGHPGAQATA